MTEALVRGEILPFHMILQDSVLVTIVNSNGEDVFIKGHKQGRVLFNIVTSNREDLFIKGHKQVWVCVNTVTSNREDVIIKQDRVLNKIMNSTGEDVVI